MSVGLSVVYFRFQPVSLHGTPHPLGLIGHYCLRVKFDYQPGCKKPEVMPLQCQTKNVIMCLILLYNYGGIFKTNVPYQNGDVLFVIPGQCRYNSEAT